MKQQNSSSTLGDKFLNYVNSLCIGVPYQPTSLPQKPSSPQKSRRSSVKPKRMTFLLDRALLKLSRKNLIVQQFAGQQALNIQIQQHLASRLSKLGLVTFQGDFPDKTVKSVGWGIRLSRESREQNVQQPIELLLANSLPKSKQGQSPQAMVFNSLENSFKTIGEVLAANFRKVKHFVFIIQAEVQAIDYHGLFAIYREYFLFEVEKIMVINKCIANILYVSASAEFLKLDNTALAHFLSEEITVKDPVVNRNDFMTLSLRLLNANLHVETIGVVGELIATSINGHYDEQFVIRMKKRYSKSVGIVDEFLKELRTVYEEEGIKQLPKFHQNTPEFKNEELEVQNFERGQFENSGLSEKNGKNLVHVSFGVGMMVGIKRNLEK